MHSQIGLAKLAWVRVLGILLCILKATVLAMQISTVIVNLNLVSKVKGGDFSMCASASYKLTV